ncbi:RpS16 [Ecytonucleospora hepatopenaei]|uniref:RpS16 n=1 Tax=Ecytonucleospora hepatopenaei TaxID=646526 RepID=A0A1W0E6U5_9MICR|nr:RpS16 [Ecytonucleospora hepatopenaei]
MSTKIIAKGQKKTSTAVCECSKTGDFEIRVNKVPLNIYSDYLMQSKLNEVVEVIGMKCLGGLDFDITLAKNCGFTGRVYAARQAFCRAVLAYYGTYAEECKKQEIHKRLMAFDRFAVVTDTRVKEPKKYGGPGARARYQKSYR